MEKEEEVIFLKLFAVDEDEFKKVKDVNPDGVLSMDILLHYLYEYYVINTSRDVNEGSDKEEIKKKFIEYVESYKSVERKKTFSKVEEILIRRKQKKIKEDPLLNYLRSMGLEQYLMLFSNYDGSGHNNLDVFKLLLKLTNI